MKPRVSRCSGRVRSAPVAVILALVVVAVPVPTLAVTNVLSRVERETTGGVRAIRIFFNAPRRVVTYTPAARGRLLEIRLASPVPDAATREPAAHRESLPWTADAGVPLSEVAYEPDGGIL